MPLAGGLCNRKSVWGVMFEGVLAVSSYALTALICLHADGIGRSLGVIDCPDNRRKHHAMPTPLMGGLAVLLPFFLLVIALRHSAEPTPIMPSIFILAGGFTVLGYLDDRWNLDAKFRLAAGVSLIVAALLHEPGHLIRALDFGFATLPLGTEFGLAFTIVVVLGLINAVNMADGMNGIVSGVGVIWALCLAVYSPPVLLPLLLVLAALLSVVLIFNLRGKLFLGDAGAYGLGALFSLLTIHVYNGTGALTADIVIAWFIVPVMDCVRLMVCRTLRGRSPFRADLDHLHHRLQWLVPADRVFLVYWALIGIPSLGAMAAPGWSFAFIGGVVAAYGTVILFTSERASLGARLRRKVALPLARS